ncbi:MAG: SNF2-related protein [Salinivirgaceae bacterium]|jgi:SNF2 family DNA or RNA helicase|nr:SNF2-related protein [Salinivirgaceae bacterium]
MTKQLIISISVHRKFGPLFSGHIITPTEGTSFYSSIEKANNVNIQDIDNGNTESTAIVKIITEYDDNNIANFFTKKKEDAREFIKNVDAEFVAVRIRPYIERRLLNISLLLPKSGLQIFFKDKGYTAIYRADEIKLAGPKAKAVFNFIRHNDGLNYFLTINHESETIKLKNKKATILTDSPCIFVLDNKLYSFDDIDSKKLLPFFSKEAINIPKQTEKTYFEKFILNTILSFNVHAEGFEIIESNVIPKVELHFQNDMQNQAVLLIRFIYGNHVILPNSTSEKFVFLAVENDSYTFTKILRQRKSEETVNTKLYKLGLISNDSIHFYPEYDTFISENDKRFATINWINQNIVAIRELGIEIKQTFFPKKYFFDGISLKLNLEKSDDWFDVKGIVKLGSFEIPFLKLRKHILNEKREYELPDGTIAILPLEWFAKYKRLFTLGENFDNSIRLNNFQFGLIDEIEEGIDTKEFEQIKELFEGKFNNSKAAPKELNATLRPYQLSGFNWMNQLGDNGFGGCLADDMGLGKTIQTITLLLNASKILVDEPLAPQKSESTQFNLFNPPPTLTFKGKMAPTSLIVMPTSLIYNWESEIEKFSPSLKTMQHTGAKRIKDIWEFKKVDVVLTTYGVIRNDFETLKDFPFNYVILDESQAIKNASSKAYKAIIKLKAEHRLAITGTPVENSLTDLWSQMNFINPGLLGNLTYFINEFVTPIEKQNDEEKSQKLQSLIHPFILRRTKDQVAKDLPPKTEQIRYCVMADAQKKIYEKEKSVVRNSILENIGKKNKEKGEEKTAFMILQALTKLRQLANHPSLVGSNEESGKFEEVTRMLENIIAEKHKVLIFSSFTQHLALYENYLNERNLKYSILTGKTTNRQKVIEEFQNNADNHVFLISLKAGGVGLNLTAADYVFLLDPWWNPAAENQAINRAHRIGQDKKVFVYRFISSDSIEEKIVRLQEKKSELADIFINSNNPFKALSPEKIKELFE